VHGSLRQACPEQSRRAQDRLWLTTNGVVGELTTNRWFDRLITNGVVGELTTNRWFDELTTNGVVGELTTNRWFDGHTTNGIFCTELVDRQHGISPRTDPAFSALPWPCDPQLLAAWMWRWQAPGGWRLNVQPAGLQLPVARNAIDCRLKDWRVALPRPAPGRKRIPTARRQRDFNFREAIREYTMDGSKRTGVRLLHGSQRMGGPAGDPNRTTGHGF